MTVVIFGFGLVVTHPLSMVRAGDSIFPSCKDVLPKAGDKAHYSSGLHQILGGSLLSGSDDVYTLENSNYLQCFCPEEGNEGIQTNWLRSDNPIEGWFFENGSQWNLGDYMYAAKNNDFTCGSPEPSPTPTPSPTPENTPNPGPGVTKDFYSEPWCDGHITLHLTYKSGEVGFDKVKVRFSYNNETKEVETNAEGRARVDFAYSGEMKARVEFAGDDRTTDVKAAVDCDTITDSGRGGQVLGTTTMAGTGVFSDTLMNILGATGSLMTMLGIKLYGKKN
jgi:hypothetical protein